MDLHLYCIYIPRVRDIRWMGQFLKETLITLSILATCSIGTAPLSSAVIDIVLTCNELVRSSSKLICTTSPTIISEINLQIFQCVEHRGSRYQSRVGRWLSVFIVETFSARPISRAIQPNFLHNVRSFCVRSLRCYR